MQRYCEPLLAEHNIFGTNLVRFALTQPSSPPLGPVILQRVWSGGEGEREMAHAQKGLDQFDARCLATCCFVCQQPHFLRGYCGYAVRYYGTRSGKLFLFSKRVNCKVHISSPNDLIWIHCLRGLTLMMSAKTLRLTPSPLSAFCTDLY